MDDYGHQQRGLTVPCFDGISAALDTPPTGESCAAGLAADFAKNPQNEGLLRTKLSYLLCDYIWVVGCVEDANNIPNNLIETVPLNSAVFPMTQT
jgi:hypothetical protein